MTEELRQQLIEDGVQQLILDYQFKIFEVLQDRLDTKLQCPAFWSEWNRRSLPDASYHFKNEKAYDFFTGKILFKTGKTSVINNYVIDVFMIL